MFQEKDITEYEVRFYYAKTHKKLILDKLDKIESLHRVGTFYEKTIQYNSRLSGNDFYSKEIDGRYRINPDDYENLVYLTEKVLKMERVESYERYRTNYSNDTIEISVDEYLFGIALEIEAKTSQNQEQVIDKYVKLLEL